MISEEKNVAENVNLLYKNFKSIADITVNFDRYDIILYSYDEINGISKFIDKKTSIKYWTALKTNVNPDIETFLK